MAIATQAAAAAATGAATGVTTGAASEKPAASAQYESERERFNSALRALELGEWSTFDTLASSLENYPLYRYLAYQRLRTLMDKSADSDSVSLLNQFEADFADAALTGYLTRFLQRKLIATEQWELFLNLSKSRVAGKMTCATARALHETDQLSAWNDDLLAFWSKAGKRPELCADALAALEKQKSPGIVAIWEYIFASIDAGRLNDARGMLPRLGTRDRTRLGAWLDARESPVELLQGKNLAKDDLLNRRAILDLVRRWSWQDPPAALDHWQKIRNQYAFFDDDRYELSRELALRGAWRRLPEAHDWLYTFEVRDDDLEVMEWRIRTALLAEDWPALLKSLHELPAEEQIEDHWAYWEARALEATGKQQRADDIYRKVAILPTYHGFLAADRLNLPYQIKDSGIQADAAVLAELRLDPGLIRAREYAYVGIPWEGRREWATAIKDFAAPKIAASALIASEWGLPDRAIVSANTAEEKAALALRFPFVFEADVERAAAQHRLDPEIIYGVMRRESSFIPDIKSPAGAIGLMQLMPKTAKYVAGLMGRSKSGLDLTDHTTNIEFGSFYLRYVMDKYDQHLALGAASYNAGPHRTRDWLPSSGTMPADVWIDSIPFTETRRYVRAVLAYATIFDWRSGGGEQVTRISDRVGPIKAPEAEASEVADNG